MTTPPFVPSYKRHRYPSEIISHAIWRSYRFSLSFRDVEELMAARCGVLSHETIRRWTRKCGQQYANELRRRRPPPGDTQPADDPALMMYRGYDLS